VIKLQYVPKRKSDEDLREDIECILGNEPVIILQTINTKKRNEILKTIKEIEDVSQRQIARVTGINQSIISQA